MRTLLIGWLFAPALVLAQAGFPTEFPPGAVTVPPDDLQKKLTGRVAQMKYANGAEVRVEYRDSYAYINVGNSSDSGKWRVQATQVCIDWQRFPAGCFEVRAVGDVLYAKRATNGEIVAMPLN